MGRIKEFLLKSLVAYLGVGAVYALSGYALRAIEGKQEVFHPLIGLPLAVLDWPGSLGASLRHFGWSAQEVLTLAAALIAVTTLLVWLIRPGLQARQAKI